MADVLELLRAGLLSPQDLQRLMAIGPDAMSLDPALPPPDELIRPPPPNFRAPTDFRGLAQPYRGPMTGDPVINQPQVGTYDRPPTVLTPELRHQVRNPPYTQMPVAARRAVPPSPSPPPWLAQLNQSGPNFPTQANPAGKPPSWVGEPNPAIPPPRDPSTLPPVLRPDLPPAPPTGLAPYQPTSEPIGFGTPMWNTRANLGFGGMYF